MLKDLSAKLDLHLEENQVEGPYLNPAYKDKTKPAAEIDTVTFDASNRKATVTLNESSPKIATAYVIYRDKPVAKENKVKGEKKRNPKRGKKPDARLGMKMPVTILGDTVIAQIPEGIEAYCFLLIDENNYQTFSDILLAQ